MMNEFGLLIKKYAVSTLFILTGLVVLIVGLKNNQDTIFLFAAGMILLAGILSALFSMGKLKPAIVYGSGIAVGIIAIVLLVMSWGSVKDSTQYQKDRDFCYELAKQNLMDIRYVQKVHKEQHGSYIDNWDDFVDFVNNGTMPYVVSEGVVPGVKITSEERDYLYGDNRPIDNNMTEEEAYRLSKWQEGPRYAELFASFKRDTVPVSILKTKFKNASYVANRKKMGFYNFSADSLPIIPYTGSQKWEIQTADSVLFNDMKDASIYVHGMIPFAKIEGAQKNIEMYFGSKDLSTHDLTGSWEEE